MDPALAANGVLCLVLGAWMVLRRNAIAESGARWQIRMALDGEERDPAEFKPYLVGGGFATMAGGIVLLIASLA